MKKKTISEAVKKQNNKCTSNNNNNNRMEHDLSSESDQF